MLTCLWRFLQWKQIKNTSFWFYPSCLFSVFHKAQTVTLENTQPDFFPTSTSILICFMYPCIIVLLVFLVLEMEVYIKRNKITDLSFNLYFVFHLKFCKIPLQVGGPSLRDSGPLTMVEVSQTSNLAPLQFILNINIPPGNAWFNVSHIIAFSCQCSILFLSEVAFYCTILGDNDSSHQYLRYWIRLKYW